MAKGKIPCEAFYMCNSLKREDIPGEWRLHNENFVIYALQRILQGMKENKMETRRMHEADENYLQQFSRKTRKEETTCDTRTHI